MKMMKIQLNQMTLTLALLILILTLMNCFQMENLQINLKTRNLFASFLFINRRGLSLLFHYKTLTITFFLPLYIIIVRKIQTHRHSLDIYSLTYAVSQFTRTSVRKEQNSSNISKTTCQKLANEKRSLNSINYHNSNTPT